MTDHTNKKRLLEAVQILADHNKWRRGEDDSSMPARDVSPMLLGQAIDTVVQLVPGLVDGLVIANEMVDAAFNACYYAGGSLNLSGLSKMRAALIAALGEVKA